MTMRPNKIEPDDLDMLLNEAERDVAGNLLRAAREEIEPSLEFAQELESRLLASGSSRLNQPDRAVRQPQQGRAGIMSKLPTYFGGKSIGRFRRVTPVVFGALGVAAMLLLFVVMAAMLNLRKQSNPVQQLPITPVGREDTLKLIPKFELLHTLPLHLSIAGTRDMQIAWSTRDDTLVALHSQGGTSWDGEKGQVKMFYPSQEANNMALSPDGRWVAMGGAGGVQLYDSQTGKGPYLASSTSAPGTFNSSPRSITWSPDSKFLAVTAQEVIPYPTPTLLVLGPRYPYTPPATVKGTIQVWDVDTGQVVRTIRIPSDSKNNQVSVYKITWSPVGSTLASLSAGVDGGEFRLWDASTGELLYYLATNRMYGTAQVEWSPDGRTLAVLAGRRIELWDTTSGKLLKVLPEELPELPTPQPTSEAIPAVPMTPAQPQPNDYNYITSLLWSPDGTTLLATDGGHIRLWDPATGQVRLAIQDSSFWLALSPDGRVLVAGGWGDVVLRDAATGEQLRTIPFQQARLISWSSRGDMMALSTGIADVDASIAVWGVRSEAAPIETPMAQPTFQPVPTIAPTSLTPSVAPTILAPSAIVQPTSALLPTTGPVSTPGCGLIWSEVPSHSEGTLNGVAAISSRDVWAVGYTADSPAKTLVQHWDGEDWRIIPSPNFGTEDNKLNGVAALSVNDVWAVGYYGNDHPSKTLTLHWDGATWKSIASPDAGSSGNQLLAIAAIAPDDIWAVGLYTICNDSPCTPRTLTIHWNGKEWSIVPSPNPGWDGASEGTSLSAVAATSANDVWAVGRYSDKSKDATVAHPVAKPLFLHWDGKAWSQAPGPDIEGYIANLTAIAAISANDVWAVGIYTTGDPEVAYLSVHWDGRAWTENPDPRLWEGTMGGFNSIAAASSNDIWAAGWDLPSRHWDGKEWSRLIRGYTNDGLPNGILFDMAVVSPNDIWAVGGLGYNMQNAPDKSTLIMHYTVVSCGTPTPTP